MKKYIVKNCPATYQNFEDKFVCTSQIKQKDFPFYCENCTDCPIKQIVKKCKRTGFTALMGGDELLKIGILNLLEIERVK